MYVHANPNPNGVYVEDCVIRAIAIATNRSWDDIYVHMCLQGYIMKNMPSVNKVWGTYLTSIGFQNYPILDTCPDCYMQNGRPVYYGRNGMSGRRSYDGEKENAMNDLRRMMSMEQDPEKRGMIENAIHALEMK